MSCTCGIQLVHVVYGLNVWYKAVAVWYLWYRAIRFLVYVVYNWYMWEITGTCGIWLVHIYKAGACSTRPVDVGYCGKG